MIEVTYDGQSPTACMGTLEIKKNGVVIYSQDGCCSSSGGVWIDEDGNEHIDEGALIWLYGDLFDIDIQDKVAEVLSEIQVCCGGCI